MRERNTLLSLVLVTLLLFAGCPSGADEGNNSNVSNEPVNSGSNETANDALGGITKTPAPESTVEAVTLKPVVDAYCDAMRKGDEAALRKVYSRATLRSYEADMRADGVSLVELLSTEPVGDRCTVVNERIQGDVGEATVITKTYPNGLAFKFVRENGEWKMTNQSSDFDAVRKSAGN